MSALTADKVRPLYTRSQGKDFEPQLPMSDPIIQRLVQGGWMKVVDGRCGFERMKDAMLAWTPAAHAALATQQQEPADGRG